MRVRGQLITIPVLNPGWKAALPARGAGMEWRARMDAVGRGCSSGWFRRNWSSSENLTGHGWVLMSSQRLFQVAPGVHPPACLVLSAGLQEAVRRAPQHQSSSDLLSLTGGLDVRQGPGMILHSLHLHSFIPPFPLLPPLHILPQVPPGSCQSTSP